MPRISGGSARLSNPFDGSPIDLSIFDLSHYLSVHLSIHLSVHLSIYLSIRPSIYILFPLWSSMPRVGYRRAGKVGKLQHDCHPTPKQRRGRSSRARAISMFALSEAYCTSKQINVLPLQYFETVWVIDASSSRSAGKLSSGHFCFCPF